MADKKWVTERQGTRSLPWLPHVAGRYYFSQVGCGSQSTLTAVPAINTLYGQPFFVPDQATYTGIAVNISLGNGAGRNARLGIYNDNGAGAPGSLVLDASTVDYTNTGVKEILISQALSPGWYWLAYVSNSGTPTLHGYTVAQSLGWLGLPVAATNSNSNFTFWEVAFTYAALPDPFTAGGALGRAATGNMKIMMKI